MPNHDPDRLRQGRGTPPELVRALDALRSGADNKAHLARLTAKLGPLLDAAPTRVADTTAAPGRRLAFKLIVGGLALVGPVLWLLRTDPPAAPAPRSPELAAITTETPTPAAVEAPVPVATQLDKTGPVPRTRPRVRRQKPEPTAGAALASSSQTAPTITEPQPQQVPSPQPVSAPRAEPRPALAERPPTAAPHVSSESELLFAARKALQHDATRALQILDEHTRRYPNGNLVPERELLAIEALRGVGRASEADARLRRFKTRYPDSFHLERLRY